MKFIDRFKRDNGFKLKVIGLVIIAILLFNANKEKKEAEQSTCNQANSQTIGTLCDFDVSNSLAYNKIGRDICMKSIGTDEDETLCVGLKCSIGRGDEDWVTDTLGCFDCVPAGLFVTESGVCCGSRISMDGPSDYNYLCQQETPGTECSANAFEESLAKLLWPKYVDNCKTAYMIILIGGGAFLLVLILSAL